MDYLNSEHLSAKDIILRDFNVRNEAWLISNRTNSEGRAVEALAISYGLFHLVNKPTYFWQQQIAVEVFCTCSERLMHSLTPPTFCHF